MIINIELPNFSEHEFDCRCGCGLNNIKPELLAKLQECRARAGIPFVITSGSRCPGYNKFVGGVDNSEHLTGEAVDIKTMDGNSRFKVLREAFEVGFNRIGIGANFIHLGIGENLSQEIIWCYYDKY